MSKRGSVNKCMSIVKLVSHGNSDTLQSQWEDLQSLRKELKNLRRRREEEEEGRRRRGERGKGSRNKTKQRREEEEEDEEAQKELYRKG